MVSLVAAILSLADVEEKSSFHLRNSGWMDGWMESFLCAEVEAIMHEAKEYARVHQEEQGINRIMYS